MFDQVSKFTNAVDIETGHNTNIKMGSLLQLKGRSEFQNKKKIVHSYI